MAKGSASTVKGEGCLVHTEFRRSPIWSSGQSIAGTPEAWDNMRMVDGTVSAVGLQRTVVDAA